MNFEYKSVNYKFKNRWTNADINTKELDDEINIKTSDGWEFVSISITTLLGYPRSALCVYKREK